MSEELAWSYRPLTLDDVPEQLAWHNDPALHKLTYTRPFRPYALEEFVAYWKRQLNRPYAAYYLLLCNGQPVGRVGLTQTPLGKIAEFSILIGPQELCGRGLGTQVTKQMIGVAFEDSNVELVRLFVRKENERAIRCYEKAGFREVHAFTQNGVPALMMQVERRDWQTSAESGHMERKGRNDDERTDRLAWQAQI